MNRISLAKNAMAAVALIALFGTGCASKIAERDFFDHKETTTLLRSHLEDGEPVDRGFQHPITITEERLIRILSLIEVRVEERFHDPEPRPAIAPNLLPRVARALSESLQAANSGEEVAVLAVRKSRHLGLFSEKTLTTFVAYVKDDLLTIAMSRVDWNLSNLRTSAQNRLQLPKPRLGEKQMKFRIVPNPDFEAAGPQAIAVRFMDPRWDVTAKAP